MHSEATNSDAEGTHYARLSDGKTAAARDVRARLDLSGVAVSEPGGRDLFRWPYESLSSMEPLRPHAVDVLLSSSQTPGATLFVPNAGFARLLATRAPQLTARSQRWRHARPWLIGSAILAALIALATFTPWSPTQMFARMLPLSWRARLGTAAIESMAENRKRCVDAAGLAALDKLATRLTTSSGRTEPFKIVVVDWDLVNAFAVPGDQIVMTKGLIEHAESPDEVAGVLAHEMGHGIELHPETGIVRAVGLSAAVELMMGGSGGTLANLGVLLAQLGYTRAAEREADVRALELMRKAEISPQGLASFFKRVMKEEGEDDSEDADNEAGKEPAKDQPRGKTEKTGKRLDPFNLLRSHPPTKERAEMIARQGSYPSTPALDAGDWKALKDVCIATMDAPKS